MAAPAQQTSSEASSEAPDWLSGIMQLTNRMLGSHSIAADTPTSVQASAAAAPAAAAASAPIPEEPTIHTATDDPGTSADAVGTSADAPAPQAEEAHSVPIPKFTEDSCPVCMEELTEAKAWPANCGHSFCSNCSEACLRRSLNCPICRTPAPESARPGPSRQAVLLTAVMMIRLRELERLRQETPGQASDRPSRRRPASGLGRWVQQRYVAANNYVDSLLD